MAFDRMRGLKFPDSVRDALQEIERSVSKVQQHGEALIPGIGGHEEEAAIKIADEFIFLHRPGMMHPFRRYTAIQELQLLEVLIQFFDDQKKEVDKSTVFLSIFASKGPTQPHKVDLLCKLVSMAIALRTRPILDCAAAWMCSQQHCSPPCLQLVCHIIHDYFSLVPDAAESLQQLPRISNTFVCNFLIAMAYVYTPRGITTLTPVPLTNLLIVITNWISTDPGVLLDSTTQFTKPFVESPFPGLISWCIHAPLLVSQGNNDKLDSEEIKRINHVYSKLFFGVLSTLLSTTTALVTHRDLVPYNRLQETVNSIATLMESFPDAVERECVQVALERLGQIIQVGLVTKTIFSDKVSLRQLCSKLPQNRLLEIVLA